METIKMIFNTLLTPVMGVSEYINVASVSYKKDKQIEYFTKVQSTLLPEKQQDNTEIKERARAISELWNQD